MSCQRMTVPCKSDQSKRGGDGDRLPEADRSRRENDNNTFPAEAHQHKQKGQPRRIGLFAFYWCRREESNPRPSHYECAALPTELHRLRARTITDRAPGFKCCAAFFELTCFGQITPLSQSRDAGLVASQVARRPSDNIANEINFSSYIYFLGLVHYTARQLGAEETGSTQNATPGVYPPAAAPLKLGDRSMPAPQHSPLLPRPSLGRPCIPCIRIHRPCRFDQVPD